MHRMTRLPESAEIRAPFDGREFRFKDDVARFEQVGGARFVRVRSAARGEHVYRVTKVIGGRYREDFAGVEVASTDPAAAVVGDPHAELILPASYVFQTASFRLKGYSVMVGTRPGMRAGGVWNETCIFCHNTIPYFDDLWGALAGPGGPRYQGEVVDRVLPEARRMRYAVADRAGLTRALDEEVAVLETGSRAASGAPLASGAALSSAAAVTSAGAGPAVSDPVRAALHQAMRAARSRFEPRHFVEIGIGCEACHGGSREHVAHPSRHPTFEPRAAFLTVSPPRGPRGASATSAAEWQNRACARCHQVLFSRYPQTWEGGSRRKPGEAGGSHISSGEARDFCWAAAPARCPVRPVTIHTARTHGSICNAWRLRRRTAFVRAVTKLWHGPTRCARTPTTIRPGRGLLRRVSHAAQEYGSWLRVDAVSPDRLTDGRDPDRTRSSDRMRALPRRKIRGLVAG